MLAGLFLAGGLLFSSMTATTAWLKIKNSQFISVKGSARKNVKSDLAIWRGTFVTEADTLLDAQHELKNDREKVAQFLGAESITNVSFAPISIEEIRSYRKDADGYTHVRTSGFRLSQSVRVETGDVERVGQLDSRCAVLVESGVQFTTQHPDFIYTKAGEAKIEMLAEATKDARSRAEQIATHGGGGLSHLHNADMGVFQITPLHGQQTHWEGVSDTSSPDKTITAVVTVTFALK